MRVPITVTNINKYGKVTNKWYVKIGRKFRVFGKEDWLKDGLQWINSALTGAGK